jgi:NADH-ubiquinone oxidoreductase chain 5
MLIYFKLSRVGYNIFSFFNQRFLIELFYNRFITGLVLKLGGQTTKVIDKGSVELLGPYGLEKTLYSISTHLDKLSTGVVTSYALYIVTVITLYMIIPISSGIVCIFMITMAGIVLPQKSGSLYNSPKPHAFTSLPMESSFSLFNLIKPLFKRAVIKYMYNKFFLY